jgi:hypothetical protein
MIYAGTGGGRLLALMVDHPQPYAGLAAMRREPISPQWTVNAYTRLRARSLISIASADEPR